MTRFPSHLRASLQSAAQRLVFTIRAPEWWHSKIPLALAVAYVLAWREEIALSSLWYPLSLLFLAGIAGGVFASVFNDLFDQREDRLAGKRTGIMALSRRGKLVALLLIEAFMASLTYLLLPYRFALTCFLVLWGLYTAYSLPPLRLKERGTLGVLCIALGEHLTASLLAVALVLESSGKPLPIYWFIALIVWSVAVGCRSILWHQLCDYKNDRETGTATMGSRYDFNTLRGLGERYLFPLEIAAFIALLILTNWERPNPLSWELLAGYIVLEWLRYKYMAANIVIVAPQWNPRFALFEYYQLFFPLAYLISAARTDAGTYPILAVQLLIFPQTPLLALENLCHLLRWRFYPLLVSRERQPEYAADGALIEKGGSV